MQRLLQMKMMSTEDLRIKRKTITKNLFVIIRTDCNNIWTSKKLETGPKTSHEGKQYDDTLEMDLAMHVGFISVEVHHSKRKNCDNSKFIGAARVPVSDFLGSFVPENYVRYLSYRLRDADGVRNGVINISIKVTPSGYVPKAMSSSSAVAELGVPVPVYDGKMTAGIVSGVPVNWCVQ